MGWVRGGGGSSRLPVAEKLWTRMVLRQGRKPKRPTEPLVKGLFQASLPSITKRISEPVRMASKRKGLPS